MLNLAPAPTQPFSTPSGPLAAFCVEQMVRALGGLSPAGRRRLAGLLGGLAYGLRIRRRVTLDNLRQAFPKVPEAERRRVARGAYANMAHTVLDALTSSLVSPAQAEGLLEEGPGAAAFHAAVAQGQGVLLATGHLGSWELFGALLQKRGVPMSGVVRPLKGAFNARIVDNRVRAGSELIAPRGALAATLRALRRGRVVLMVIDQSIPAEHGVFVPFFGRLACTAPAVSLAAVRSGAPVFFGYGRRVGERLVFQAEGPLPVTRTGDLRADLTAHTALLTERLERAIRAEPTQWLWLHRRWKVRPPAEPEAGALEAAVGGPPRTRRGGPAS